MATYLTMVNNVLARLRSNQVSSVTDTTYSLLIGKFVNEAKREVEDSWNWTALRSLVSVTTAASTAEYSLTGTNKRTRIFEGYNSTENAVLHHVSDQMYNRYTELGDTPSGDVHWWRISGYDSSDQLQVTVYPTPEGVATLKFWCIIPQDDLSSDNDTLTVPEWPVILGGWSKAVSERGEDQGQLFTEIDVSYRKAQNDAIAIDANFVSRETDWVPV